MDQATWDDALAQLDGPLLQSWRWGEYRRGQGWAVERIRVDGPAGTGLAQVLFKRVGPMSLAHLPRGPVVDGDAEAVMRELIDAVDEVCRKHRSASLVAELDRPLLSPDAYDRLGLVTGPPHLHPARTVKVALDSDEQLL